MLEFQLKHSYCYFDEHVHFNKLVKKRFYEIFHVLRRYFASLAFGYFREVCVTVTHQQVAVKLRINTYTENHFIDTMSHFLN